MCLITLWDGDTFPITEHFPVCLYIFIYLIWFLSLSSSMSVIAITSSVRRSNLIEHLFFIFSLIWQLAIPQGTLLIFFLCLSSSVFMTEAENHKRFYVLPYCWLSTFVQNNDIPVVPHFTSKTFQNQGSMGGVTSEG